MTNNKPSTLSHDECKLLLPSYINGQLSSNQRRAVQEHVAHCSSCFDAQLEAQLITDQLSQNPEELDDLLRPSRVEMNLDKTLDMIDAEAAATQATEAHTTDTPSQPASNFFGRLGQYWNDYRDSWQETHFAFKGLMFAQTAALVVVVALSTQETGPEPQSYQTLSEPQLSSQSPSISTATTFTQGYPVFRVIFHPGTAEADMRLLMTGLKAQIISGPTSAGVYTISTLKNQTNEPAVLQTLRASPWVRLAEPAVHRDAL